MSLRTAKILLIAATAGLCVAIALLLYFSTLAAARVAPTPGGVQQDTPWQWILLASALVGGLAAGIARRSKHVQR